MTLFLTASLIMTIIIILNAGDITYNCLYLQFIFTLLITVNKKQMCNVALINVISKVIISKVFISIVVMPNFFMDRSAIIQIIRCALASKT